MTTPPICTETETGPNTADMSNNTTGIDPKLLEILVCPLTKGPLTYDADAQELISEQARLDGIPIMLVDEARPLDGEA